MLGAFWTKLFTYWWQVFLWAYLLLTLFHSHHLVTLWPIIDSRSLLGTNHLDMQAHQFLVFLAPLRPWLLSIGWPLGSAKELLGWVRISTSLRTFVNCRILIPQGHPGNSWLRRVQLFGWACLPALFPVPYPNLTFSSTKRSSPTSVEHRPELQQDHPAERGLERSQPRLQPDRVFHHVGQVLLADDPARGREGHGDGHLNTHVHHRARWASGCFSFHLKSFGLFFPWRV